MASKLIWNGAEIEARVTSAAKEAIDETNEASAVRARTDAPYRTGELREGIGVIEAQIGTDSIQGQLVSRARHSLFVELGTSKMPAQPHLRPAADSENTKLASRIASRLR